MFLYNHGGSANHGCEALVRTVGKILSEQNQVVLYSEVPQQDYRYGIPSMMEIRPAVRGYSKLSLEFWKAYVHLKAKGNYFQMDILPYRKSIRELKSGDVEISIGGDIYCYEDYPKYIALHKLIDDRGCKSVLLGCSLEERLFHDPVFLEDMRRYDFISARESITYGLLKSAGFSNIACYPDSAFTLEKEELPLPDEFVEGNTVGINVSPLVARKESIPGIVYRNYANLIQDILDHSDAAVALIPHVVWQSNDDRAVLKQLYEQFRETGRVCLIPDCNCMQLKGYIARCRFFIGARTHATIAAYSTCVPTLVLGYSIKSRGIALDLFGTDEHYVLPVEKLHGERDLIQAFQWIKDNEQKVSTHLKMIMGDYIQRANEVKKVIEMV